MTDANRPDSAPVRSGIVEATTMLLDLRDAQPNRSLARLAYVLAAISVLMAWPVSAFFESPLLGMMAVFEPVILVAVGMRVGARDPWRWVLPVAGVAYLVPLLWGLLAGGRPAFLAGGVIPGGAIGSLLLWPLQVLWLQGFVIAVWTGFVTWT